MTPHPANVAAANLKLKLLAKGIGKDEDTGLLVMDHYCAVCRYDGTDGEGECNHKLLLEELEGEMA